MHFLHRLSNSEIPMALTALCTLASFFGQLMASKT